jgi:transposase
LTSIPGLSAITAFALLIEMPKLGALEQGQAASLAALRPSRDNPPGGSDAFIRGGRASVR